MLYLGEAYTHLHEGRVEIYFVKTTLDTPDRDLNLPIIDCLFYSESHDLDHVTTKAGAPPPLPRQYRGYAGNTGYIKKCVSSSESLSDQCTSEREGTSFREELTNKEKVILQSCSMKLLVIVIAVVVTLVTADDYDEEREKRQSAFYQQQARSPGPQRFGPPQGFRSSPADEEEDEGLSRNTVTPSPLLLVYRPRAPQDSVGDYQNALPVRGNPQQPQVRRPGPPPPPGRGPLPQGQEELLEEELEEEKPDRLSVLLPQSKFDCTTKNTGYYADEGLNCEVFHYCHDNAKHSWVCPEGFLFHQVHLICMPPSGENICKQSSQYHFVNDYLYKPVNAEEAQNNINVSLRYSERYYPETYYEEGEDRPDQPIQRAPAVQRVPIQNYNQLQIATAAPPRAKPVQFQTSLRPQQQFVTPSQLRQQSPNQVFHSPEEVNIPLQQRRPFLTTPSPPQRNYQPVREEEEYEYDEGPFRG
uniref:(California timema) hypothetical protein n=1 Tax=Timema californicum TaxID=61474 RepID=A0A7R9P6F2_TIMCA|nr:unnamed protein product [Timema californicum]